MKKYILTLAVALLCFTAATAQKYMDMAGTVTDTSGTGLAFASVVLLQAKDSVIAGFCVSEADGRFAMKKVETGEYLLQVSFVGFETHHQPLSVTGGGSLDLGRIALQPSSAMLEGVEVAAERVPMRFQGDTIEYNAAAFKTQAGAVVEDLLKKLPGVEVQRDGSIRANGETVQNVLVDGKEFFSGDPTIATKNLPADAVDKVQVYDKKSERAEFTGIEDGREEKTINLSLKEDKKHGYFGNATAGGGSEERYEGRFNLNRFSSNTQLSAIGMANNTGQQGFSFNDYMQFMGGLSNMMGGGGSGGSQRVSISLDPAEMGLPIGGGTSNGFVSTWAGGLNFNRDFGAGTQKNKARTKLNASYFFSRIQTDLDKTSERNNLLDGSLFATNSADLRQNRHLNHRFTATLRHELDSFQNIVLRTKAAFNDAFIKSLSSTQTFSAENLLQNAGTGSFRTDGQGSDLDASLTYRRRFRHKGRALVGTAELGAGRTDRTGLVLSENLFFLEGELSDTVDQRQASDDDRSEYGLSLAFTEPVAKGLYLELGASRQNYTDLTDKRFFDRQPTGNEVLNEDLSTRYRRGYTYDRGSLNWLLNRKKYNLTLGAALQRSVLEGKLLDEDLPIGRSFTRVLPNLFFDYEFATARNLNVEYQTFLREPSLEQLRPVVDNSDPLNRYTGNPGLNPSMEHNLNLRFMNFDQFTFTSLFVNLGAVYIADHITNATTVDSLFRRTTQPVNVERDATLQGYVQFSTPLRPVKSNVNLSLGTNWNRGILFVNGSPGDVGRLSNSLEISFDNRKKEKFDVAVGVRFSRNETRYLGSELPDQRWLNQRYFADVTATPNEFWTLSTSFDYKVYPAAAQFGEATALPIWKASVGRYFLANKRGQLKISAYDLLNRNLGIRRSSELNYTEEERIRSLGRYVVLSFAYSLSGFGGKKSGIEIKVEERRD